MALNRQTLQTRSLTAVVFVVVMLAGLLINHWTFFILFSVIHFGCWIEYQKIVGIIDPGYRNITSFHRYGTMLAGWCLMLYFTNDDFHFGDFTLHPVGFWLGMLFAFLLPISELLLTNNISIKNISYSFLGIVYLSLSFALLTDLLTLNPVPHESSPAFPVLIIACMWVNDTMAYLVGSWIGETPLSPISPKKTWEGTVGGIILCVLVVCVLSRFIGPLKNIALVHIFCIALIAAIAGTLGDLLESKLKRMAGIKDSGTIMPGHGGFLDRFDSLLLATPFVWLYIELFLRHAAL